MSVPSNLSPTMFAMLRRIVGGYDVAAGRTLAALGRRKLVRRASWSERRARPVITQAGRAVLFAVHHGAQHLRAR